MPTRIPHVVGSWTKTADSACSQVYPDTIQFQENGLYTGQMNTPGMFTLWDVGTFEVVDAKQIKLSTANDAIISYEFSISHGVLTFKDKNDCEFSYRKEE